MNKETILEFKKFLKNEGAEKAFVGLYRQYHFSDDTSDIESYYCQVPREYAVVFAFNFNQIKAQNIIFDAPYWIEMHKKWNKIVNSAVLEHIKEKNKRLDDRINKLDSAISMAGVGEQSWFDNLVPLVAQPSTNTFKSSPKDNELRFSLDKPVLVFPECITKDMATRDLFTLNINADKRTNSMILVFGKDEPFNLRTYSKDKMCLQHKSLSTFFEAYLGALDPNLYYFIKYDVVGPNTDNTRYAIRVTKDFRTLNK